MPSTTRSTLSLICLLALGLAVGGATDAAELSTEVPLPVTTTGEAAPVAAGTDDVPPTSQQLRSELGGILRQHPPELATILTLDPTLLSSEAFLAGYPTLGRFVAEHPEVRRNPRYYLADFQPVRHNGAFGDFVEGLAIFSTFLLIALALAWLVRTVIEQKRWNRLSRTQSEVHNKILDRFGTSGELLDYMRTPAGSRFLESAPIPLSVDRSAQSGPPMRVMWSVQIGVVVAAAAIGMLLVSLRFDGETAQGLFAMGAIGLCVGIGFVASALVTTSLSRRLGLWRPDADPAPGEPVEEVG